MNEKDRLVLMLTGLLMVFGAIAFLLSLGAILGRHL